MSIYTDKSAFICWILSDLKCADSTVSKSTSIRDSIFFMLKFEIKNNFFDLLSVAEKYFSMLNILLTKIVDV